MFKRGWSLLKTDPRHFQIFSLTTLFFALLFWSDFAPDPLVAITTLFSCLLAQYGFSLLFLKRGQIEYRSAIISTLSLTLLLKAASLWLFPIAALIAIGSKFLIRINDKHIFNPANIAIVTLLLLTPEMVWISPGQWGREIWLGFLIIGLGALVLSSFKKADTTFFFLASYWALLTARALIIGDPFSIVLNQMQQGAMLIFAIFMISDPKTTPDHQWGRFIFAFAVASLGYLMQFNYQIREGIFYALPLICLITPLLDLVFKDKRFFWRTS